MERGELEKQEQNHEGEKYLELLGLGHLAEEQIPGRPERMRDFLEICGKHARPFLVGFESLDPDDPRFAPTRAALRDYIGRIVTLPEN